MFVGQQQAIEHLKDAVRSANARGVRLDHVMLASGLPGIGKGQPVDSQVLSPTGWRRIGDLTVGMQ